jgi:hypothetical protein
MARWPAGRGAAAQARLRFAHQMLQGVLINAVLTDPGPLKHDDPGFARELTAALQAYLGLQAAAPARARAGTTRRRP